MRRVVHASVDYDQRVGCAPSFDVSWHDERMPGSVSSDFIWAFIVGLVPISVASFAMGRFTADPRVTIVERSSPSHSMRAPAAASAIAVEAGCTAPLEPAPTAESRLDLDRAPECHDVSMQGIITADDPAQSMSLLGVGSTTEWRRRGEPIGGYRVLHVARERAWLVKDSSERAGRYAVCQTELGARASANTAAPLAATPVGPVGPGPLAHLGAKIERRGPDDFVVDRSVIDEMIEQQGALATLVRAAPDTEAGKTVGLRLLSVRPGSVLERLGLQSGDRLRRVAGVDLTSVESALIALARLRATPRFAIEIQRGGKPTQLDYEVR